MLGELMLNRLTSQFELVSTVALKPSMSMYTPVIVVGEIGISSSPLYWTTACAGDAADPTTTLAVAAAAQAAKCFSSFL